MIDETAKAILEKLQQIETAQKKGWMASLTEQSTILLDTQAIADFMGFSYHYTYMQIVSDPDFPAPVKAGTKARKDKRGRSARRWISGDVIKYLKEKRS